MVNKEPNTAIIQYSIMDLETIALWLSLRGGRCLHRDGHEMQRQQNGPISLCQRERELK